MSKHLEPAVARAWVGVAVRAGNVEAEHTARENLNEAKVSKAIRDGLAATPTLTSDARFRLAQLLLMGGEN